MHVSCPFCLFNPLLGKLHLFLRRCLQLFCFFYHLCLFRRQEFRFLFKLVHFLSQVCSGLLQQLLQSFLLPVEFCSPPFVLRLGLLVLPVYSLSKSSVFCFRRRFTCPCSRSSLSFCCQSSSFSRSISVSACRRSLSFSCCNFCHDMARFEHMNLYYMG